MQRNQRQFDDHMEEHEKKLKQMEQEIKVRKLIIEYRRKCVSNQTQSNAIF